jgi:hypothetical protein
MVVVGGLDWVWKPSNWLWALVSFPYLPALWHFLQETCDLGNNEENLNLSYLYSKIYKTE